VLNQNIVIAKTHSTNTEMLNITCRTQTQQPVSHSHEYACKDVNIYYSSVSKNSLLLLLAFATGNGRVLPHWRRLFVNTVKILSWLPAQWTASIHWPRRQCHLQQHKHQQQRTALLHQSRHSTPPRGWHWLSFVVIGKQLQLSLRNFQNEVVMVLRSCQSNLSSPINFGFSFYIMLSSC